MYKKRTSFVHANFYGIEEVELTAVVGSAVEVTAVVAVEGKAVVAVDADMVGVVMEHAVELPPWSLVIVYPSLHKLHLFLFSHWAQPVVHSKNKEEKCQSIIQVFLFL
jgi:DNA repair exonuclease SbcCD nuclease subunit